MLLKMISIKQTRQTFQKRFVEEYLASHFDHPTAEEIYLAGKEQNLRLGLTTVYRILDAFAHEGKAIVIKAGGVVHYDFVRDDHYHFVCDVCGKIIDLRGDREIINRLAARHDFVLPTLQGVVIHGFCLDCAKEHHVEKLPKEE
jgi:Fur family transcriptional regulator, peroxide stress response regulator